MKFVWGQGQGKRGRIEEGYFRVIVVMLGGSLYGCACVYVFVSVYVCVSVYECVLMWMCVLRVTSCAVCCVCIESDLMCCVLCVY